MKNQKMDVEYLYIYIYYYINTPLWVPGRHSDTVRYHVLPYCDPVFYQNTRRWSTTPNP